VDDRVIAPQGLILLSGRLATGLDLEALRVWVETTCAVPAVIIPERAGTFGRRLGQALAGRRADRLVIAIASGECHQREAQQLAQQRGVDPLGLAVLDLEAHCLRLTSPAQAVERAKLLLAGALARLLAFPGSQPENLVAGVSLEVGRRQLLRLAVTGYRTVPAIDAERCVAALGCRQCLEMCPVAALRLGPDGVTVNRTQCVGCGLCQTVCPARAVTYPGASLAELEAQLRQLLNPRLAALAPRGIIFLCERGLAALEAHVADGLRYPPGWLPVMVPCVGMLGLEVYLGSLLLGATTVGVLPCQPACPAGERGVARERIALARTVLEALGAEPGRVRVLALSSTLGPEWNLMAEPLAAGQAEPAVGTVADRRRLAQGLIQATALGEASWSVPHPQAPFGVIALDPAACTGCQTCTTVCPTGALQAEKRGDRLVITFESVLCSVCGLCVARCPERAAGALALEAKVDAIWLAAGRRTVGESRYLVCASCGRPVAPAALLRRLATILGEEYERLAPVITRYCPECRGRVG
jgi:formate hydrogenlyase subunit 6/NADH:ubiquinone oxidoreductase subunit I/coenzyme F420-reducing hydrogenase delta subunit